MLLQGVDITEMFSPERVANIGTNYKLIAGKSMDLTTGYDFSLEADRKKAWEHIVKDEPYCVIGSPPCTMFSLLMELNIAKFRDDKAWMEKYEVAKAQAVKHIEFCCKIYKYQLQHKRHFIHEHPWGARSWELNAMTELIQDERTTLVRSDLCRFGMTSWIERKGGDEGPAKKPTGFLTSSLGSGR